MQKKKNGEQKIANIFEDEKFWKTKKRWHEKGTIHMA
jgi:hypothetical protein